MRRDTANLFCAVELKAGSHFVKVTRCRKAADFAEIVGELAHRYPKAGWIHLVLDNFNIYSSFSLTCRFGWTQGLRLWNRFCEYYTPVHGSCLNQANISRQCPGCQRVATVELLGSKSRAWER